MLTDQPQLAAAKMQMPLELSDINASGSHIPAYHQ